MKGSGVSKLAVGLLVLVMALSALAVLPGTSEGQALSGVNIYVPVGSSGVAVTDAKVNLTELHTGTVLTATYSSQSGSYVVTNAPSGYYRVDVTHANYYDRMNALSVRFTGFNNYTASPVWLDAFPYKGNQWNVTVRDGSNNALVSGAMVGFYDPIRNEYVATKWTNSLGVAVISMFDTSPGDVQLIVMKNQYETLAEPVTVTADNTTTLYLQSSKLATGYVKDANGPANNVVAYLINTDPSIPVPKRVLRSYGGGSFVAFDAYTGDFTLVVDADGDSAYVAPVTVGGGDYDLAIPDLPSQNQRTDDLTIDFGGNFNSFALSVNTLWSYDEAYPGLYYKDMGSLRMQVDLVLGNGNGVLDGTEVGTFSNFVQNLGPQYVSSSGLITVNGTAFESGAFSGYVMDLAAGTVVNTAGVNYAYNCNYATRTGHELDVGAPSYTSTVYAKFDSAAVNRIYEVSLPTLPINYELVWNSTSSSSKVTVTGYSPTVTLDSKHSATSGVEAVSMEFEESLKPIAKAGIVPSAHARAIYVDKNISKYIVAANQNVTLTAEPKVPLLTDVSSDPNGNPLLYSWTFGDGGSVTGIRNATVVHKYTSAAAALTATLTIQDVAGLTNSTAFTVECDGMTPNPVLTVKVKPVVDNAIVINQKEVITFAAKTFSSTEQNSSDDAVSEGDGLGVIDYVQFFYGDGNASGKVLWTATQQNVTHSWERSGEFTMVLNVTDVVGHWKNTTLKVKVNDTQAPTVVFLVKNATYGNTLVENQTLIFDAKGVTDNVATNNKTNMHFFWDFGDGTNQSGIGLWNVTHTYQKVGSIVVKLNVTDASDNWQVAPKSIQVQSSARPNMWIDAITFDPAKKSTEGEKTYLLINMTNKGSADAKNITLYLWIVQGDDQDYIGEWTVITINGTEVDKVGPGQKAQARFPWNAGTSGTVTVKVNVTSDNQLKQNQWVGSREVNEAPWKDWLLWIGIAAVLIVIPLAIFFRSRISKVEKKGGPRREKKSGKGGEDEEL